MKYQIPFKMSLKTPRTQHLHIIGLFAKDESFSAQPVSPPFEAHQIRPPITVTGLKAWLK